MAKNTDQTKKKPTKRNRNSATNEALQQAKASTQASSAPRVYATLNTNMQGEPPRQESATPMSPQKTRRSLRETAAAASAPSASSASSTAASAAQTGTSANGKQVKRVSRSTKPHRRSDAFSQKSEQNTAAKKLSGNAEQQATEQNSSGATATDAKAPANATSGQTAYRKKSKYRVAMSAMIPHVEDNNTAAVTQAIPKAATVKRPSRAIQSGESDPAAAASAGNVRMPSSVPGSNLTEAFSSKKTVSFFEDDPENPSMQADFDPYEAADEAFASSLTQAIPDTNGGSDFPQATAEASSPTGADNTAAKKPAHPSFRFRIASSALGMKPAVPPEEAALKQPTHPAGRTIIMPKGGKLGVSDDPDKPIKPDKSELPPVSVGKKIQRALIVVLIVVLVVTGLFVWNRWFRYNDVLDVQGTWSANNSRTNIILNDQYMQLTPEVLYSYELDPFAKTISYEFGNSKGEGRYRFSFDRTQLVITDGSDYNWFSTLREDIPWTLETLWKNLMNERIKSPLGTKNVSVLKRISNDATIEAVPKTDAELAEWRQQAREEAAKAEEEIAAQGGKTVLSVTEGVPIEKPSEKDAKTDADDTTDSTASTTGDASLWDDNQTWDEGSGWDDSSLWSDDSNYYDSTWDQSWDNGYDYYDSGYDTSWDQSWDDGSGYNSGYDEYSYDQTWDDTSGYSDSAYDENYDQAYVG